MINLSLYTPKSQMTLPTPKHTKYCPMAFLPCYKVVISLAILLLLFIGSSSAQLSEKYYDSSCPKLMRIVTDVLQSELEKVPQMGVSLLRLHFHDCLVNGCDGSILLDDTHSIKREKGAAANLNSRGYEVIDIIKSNVESECPGVVSCADILTIAARDSVVIFGGPEWSLKLGRRDATTASLAAANEGIPRSHWTLDAMISRFNDLGLSAKDLVALNGAHTMIQTNKATQTPVKFDIEYYNNEADQPMDDFNCTAKMLNGKETKSIAGEYRVNPNAFGADFAAAMIKLGEIKPLTGLDGEIRETCRRVNK